MKFITLPSGIIINLEQVCFSYSPGIYNDQEAGDENMRVCFGDGPHHLKLSNEDAEVFLNEIARTGSGVNVEAARASIERKKA